MIITNIAIIVSCAWLSGLDQTAPAPGMLLAAEKSPVVAVFEIQSSDINLPLNLRRKLTEIMVTELGLEGVFRIMPPGDVEKILLEESKESYKKCFDEKCQIELGRRLPANKLVTTSIMKIGKQCRLAGSLYDLKSQTTDIVAKDIAGCGEEGLVKSIETVAAKIRTHGSRSSVAAFKEESLGGKPSSGFEVGSLAEVIVQFESTPPGAVVSVDGVLKCQSTPCSKSVPSGAHVVTMQAERYDKRQEQLELSKGKTVSWQLLPNHGWLTIQSNPAGLTAKLNGREAGKTPLNRIEQDPGIYEVMVSSPCHVATGKRVQVTKNAEQVVDVAPAEILGAVEVKARDKQDNDLSADVFIDGIKVGQTPGRFKVSVCAKELEVRHAQKGSAKKTLAVVENQISQVEVKLENTVASSGKRPVVASSGKGPVLVVMPIEDKQKALDPKLLEQLTIYLKAAITEGGIYQTVMLNDMLNDEAEFPLNQKKGSYMESFNQECQIELGKELSASKSLSTSINKLGQSCRITSMLHDLRTEATEVNVIEETTCEEERIKESLDRIANKLKTLGKSK